MFKKLSAMVVCFSFIFSLSVFVNCNVSAASHSNWEVVQDYETGDIAGLGGYGMQSGCGDPVYSIVTGDVAAAGNNSLSMETIGMPYGHWACEVIAKNIPAAKISNPSGYFFRMETNAPAGPAMLPVIKQMDWGNWATWGSYTADTIFVSDSGKVYHCGVNGNLPVDVFSGYVFVKIIGMTPTKVQDIGFTLGPWGGTAAWGSSKTIFDNLGYYSAPDKASDNDYAELSTSLKSEYPAKPDLISSITTGNYGDSVIIGTPVQMKSLIYHASAKYDWSVDNTNIATIDTNGLLTPNSIGTVNVTMSNHDKPDVAITIPVHVTFGFVTISCAENSNSNTAVYGIKYKLRGVPTFTMTDTNVVWSVVSGPATIKSTPLDFAIADIDLAGASNPSSALVSFTGSGQVVVRASYVVDPSVYSEWTFNVKPNLTYLATSITAAQGYTSSGYTAASWKALQTALAASVKLYNGGADVTTQKALDDSKTTLDAAVQNLTTKSNSSSTASSTSTPSSNSSSSEIPNTGSSDAILSAIIISMLALGGITLSVKKINK